MNMSPCQSNRATALSAMEPLLLLVLMVAMGADPAPVYCNRKNKRWQCKTLAYANRFQCLSCGLKVGAGHQLHRLQLASGALKCSGTMVL
jgi:hypothetical protein